MSKASAQIIIGRHVPFNEILFFTKHLSVMLKSGITISEALGSLSQETRHPYFKKVLTSIFQDIKNGKKLAESMDKYPKVFDNFYTNIVKIGESSGTLTDSLEYLANYLSQESSFNKKIRSALLYPAVVLTATFFIGGFIALGVLPQLLNFFEGFDAQLPFTTRALLFVATLARDYGLFLVSSKSIKVILVEVA